MNVEVIEFELFCPDHGFHKTLVPAQLPRPEYCAHCFLKLSGRRELRRFTMEGPLPVPGPEAFIG